MEVNKECLFANSRLLTQRFGEWPSFHDAEILRLELIRDSGVSLRMEVYLFTRSSEVDEHGRFRHEKPSIVTLQFDGLQDLSLAEFNEQNVLGELVCSRLNDNRLQVELYSLYGLGGQFTCSEAQVLQVRTDLPEPTRAN